MPPEEDQATVIVSMYENLVEFGRVVFQLCQRTDKRTYSSQYFAPLARGGAK